MGVGMKWGAGYEYDRPGDGKGGFRYTMTNLSLISPCWHRSSSTMTNLSLFHGFCHRSASTHSKQNQKAQKTSA